MKVLMININCIDKNNHIDSDISMWNLLEGELGHTQCLEVYCLIFSLDIIMITIIFIIIINNNVIIILVDMIITSQIQLQQEELLLDSSQLAK